MPKRVGENCLNCLEKLVDDPDADRASCCLCCACHAALCALCCSTGESWYEQSFMSGDMICVPCGVGDL